MQIIFLFSPKSSPNIKHKIPVNKNCKYGQISLFILFLILLIGSLDIVIIFIPILLFKI